MTAWMAAAFSFAATIGATWLVLGWLKRRAILDHPNERSSHALPTPRGGGLAVAPVVLAVWAGLAATITGPLTAWIWVMVGGGASLVLTSWIDDRRSLPAAPRFAIHVAVIVAALALLPTEALVFQGWLPFWGDRIVTALGWVWFVNLYNFMDGIDGITGVETAALGIGAASVAAMTGLATDLAPLGLVVGAAGLGFLVWNWHPAKIFLGDSGSIALGFLLGGLLIQLAVAGHLAAALILPAYYLADATITIGHRAVRGEKIWQAHRQHFYQRAARALGRHDRVTLRIAAADGVLVAAALVAAAGAPWTGAALAVATVAALLHWMAGRRTPEGKAAVP